MKIDTNVIDLKVTAQADDYFKYRLVEFTHVGFKLTIWQRLYVILCMIITPIYFLFTGNIKIPIKQVVVKNRSKNE